MDEIRTGKCGEKMTWTYDEPNRTLTISGPGKMFPYNNDIDEMMTPWAFFVINKMVFEEGVEDIGEDTFARPYKKRNILKIYIPESVTSICKVSEGVDYIGDIYYGGSKEQWEELTRSDREWLERCGIKSPLFKAHIHFAR